MICQFETEDSATFRIDVGRALRWSRVGTHVRSADGTAPELEGGLVIPQGENVFNLDGRVQEQLQRTLPDAKPYPGGDLKSVMFAFVPEDDTLTIVVKANVPIKNVSLPVPIESVRIIIMPGNEILSKKKNVQPE
jgi:hypothetical protein